MILYVNGDSHSYGLGVDPKQTFAYRVARHFGLTLVNQAESGASNQRILRTTQKYLANNEPAMVLIGWSTWEREEWLHNGQYYSVNSSGCPGLPKELHDQYKQWVIKQTVDAVDIKSLQWHNKIHQFHNELNQRNQKHLFFNCMYNFFKTTQVVDWAHNYIDPYSHNQSYYWYLKDLKFQADRRYHYGADAHSAWADRLIKHIEESNLL